MADIRTIFEQVLLTIGTGKKIKVEGVANEKDFHSLRTAVVKHWTEYRNAMFAVSDADDPMLTLSLCADYERDGMAAIFYLGQSRRKRARTFSFSIVDEGESSDDSSARTGT